MTDTSDKAIDGLLPFVRAAPDGGLVELLYAMLIALQAERNAGWQPIETAPLGTPVWVIDVDTETNSTCTIATLEDYGWCSEQYGIMEPKWWMSIKSETEHTT